LAHCSSSCRGRRSVCAEYVLALGLLRPLDLFQIRGALMRLAGGRSANLIGIRERPHYLHIVSPRGTDGASQGARPGHARARRGQSAFKKTGFSRSHIQEGGEATTGLGRLFISFSFFLAKHPLLSRAIKHIIALLPSSPLVMALFPSLRLHGHELIPRYCGPRASSSSQAGGSRKKRARASLRLLSNSPFESRFTGGTQTQCYTARERI
jgi:hypothetical protein